MKILNLIQTVKDIINKLKLKYKNTDDFCSIVDSLPELLIKLPDILLFIKNIPGKIKLRKFYFPQKKKLKFDCYELNSLFEDFHIFQINISYKNIKLRKIL